MKPTGGHFRRAGNQGRWRRLGALAAFLVVATTATPLIPGIAHADPGTGTGPITIPRITAVPCATLGHIEWTHVNFDTYEGRVFTIRSTTPTFDVAYGRFVQNPTPVEIDGQWTATEARTVSLTFFFSQSVTVTGPITRGFSAAVSASTGLQVQESRTTRVGVGAVAKIPPNRTMLGQYGLEGLDVVFDMQLVTAVGSAPQTCYLWLDSTIANNTAHIPTINEGWRFTLS